MCVPGASAGLTVYGDTHVVQAPPSTRHSNVPPETPPDSANDGVVSLVVPPWLGVTVGTAVGAVVLSAHVCEAGGPWLPAASTSATRNVCVPSASTPDVHGDVHAAYAPPSMLQAYVSPPRFPPNETIAVVWFVMALGALMIVGEPVGGVVSTVQVAVVAAPVLPAASTRRTQKVWLPSASAADVNGDVHAAHAPESMRHW